MKKTYIQPNLQVVMVNCEKLIADSYNVSNTTVDADAMVKGASSSSSSRYNVWDDDWSE